MDGFWSNINNNNNDNGHPPTATSPTIGVAAATQQHSNNAAMASLAPFLSAGANAEMAGILDYASVRFAANSHRFIFLRFSPGEIFFNFFFNT